MNSPARLDTKKQRSAEPQWTGMRASAGSVTAPRPDAAIIASRLAAGWVPGVRDVLVPAVLVVLLAFQVGALITARR